MTDSPPTDKREVCVWCGARPLRDVVDGTVVTWTAGAYDHQHETNRDG